MVDTPGKYSPARNPADIKERIPEKTGQDEFFMEDQVKTIVSKRKEIKKSQITSLNK